MLQQMQMHQLVTSLIKQTGDYGNPSITSRQLLLLLLTPGRMSSSIRSINDQWGYA